MHSSPSGDSGHSGRRCKSPVTWSPLLELQPGAGTVHTPPRPSNQNPPNHPLPPPLVQSLRHTYQRGQVIFSVGYTSVSSVSQSCPILQPHEPQHSRPPYPSPTPGVHSNSCASSWRCHPAISAISAIPFSSCPQSLPASGLSHIRFFGTSWTPCDPMGPM